MDQEDIFDNSYLDGIEDNPDMTEFIGSIIDVFQDFISERKIKLNNPEPTEDGWPDPELIYGSDYVELAKNIKEAIMLWSISE